MYRDGTGIDNITVTCGDYRVTVVLEMSVTSPFSFILSSLVSLSSFFSLRAAGL